MLYDIIKRKRGVGGVKTREDRQIGMTLAAPAMKPLNKKPHKRCGCAAHFYVVTRGGVGGPGNVASLLRSENYKLQRNRPPFLSELWLLKMLLRGFKEHVL